VDAALRLADDWASVIDPTRKRTAATLAAEVRALREETVSAVKPFLRAQIQELEEEVARLNALVEQYATTFTRVEALSLKWMDYVVLQTGEGIPDCADDLERALRGPT
jgi:hypothetical protein